MDWNNDGKHDWHDDAFFCNVVIKDDKVSEGKKQKNGNSNLPSHETKSGVKWFIGLLFLYIIIKIIGG